MSDIKFACPSCQQHIQCGPEYAGMQIPCPACQSQMTVPTPAGFVAPPPPLPAPALAMRSAATAVAPPPPTPAVATSGSPTCPNCGSEVSPRAIMCIKCGTNVKSGQKMTGPGGRPIGRPAAMGRGPVVWYKNPEAYAAIAFGILLLAYGSAWLSPLGILAYLGVAVLLSIAGTITVLVAAFKESVGTGFLTLCVPLYVLYFVYAQCESKFVKSMWSLGILAQVGVMFLPHNLGE